MNERRYPQYVQNVKLEKLNGTRKRKVRIQQNRKRKLKQKKKINFSDPMCRVALQHCVVRAKYFFTEFLIINMLRIKLNCFGQRHYLGFISASK